MRALLPEALLPTLDKKDAFKSLVGDWSAWDEDGNRRLKPDPSFDAQLAVRSIHGRLPVPKTWQETPCPSGLNSSGGSVWAQTASR